MAGTAWEAAWRHDPDHAAKPFSRRNHHACIAEAATIPDGMTVMLDTSFYIHGIQASLPAETAALVDSRRTIHSGIALAELAIAAGLLDPRHPRTGDYRNPTEALLRTIDLIRAMAPSASAWAEAGRLAGILARTQLSLAKPETGFTPAEKCCRDGLRRKLLNDALIFLTAREAGAVLVTSNLTDMDLLLRFRPDANVYRPLQRP